MDISNKGQLDAETLGYIKDNAEVEHAILTPFRWLMRLGKFLIYASLLFG